MFGDAAFNLGDFRNFVSVELYQPGGASRRRASTTVPRDTAWWWAGSRTR
jgi:hypothetical protein